MKTRIALLACLAILGNASPAGAAQFNTVVAGQMANNTNTCFAIIDLLQLADCSYAATRYPTRATWSGPVFGSGFYQAGHAADGNLNYLPSPGDGKYAIPMTGTVTVDDGGTPGVGGDDSISAQWIFGAAVYNALTGNGDRAVEKWDSFTQTMSATAVSSATANAAGGFDYVIGSRGAPSPLALASDPLDRFPSENANPDYFSYSNPWSTTGATGLPANERIGIERSAGYGNTNGTGGAALQPNVGGQTAGSFQNYQCLDDPGDNDCLTSPMLLGVGGAGFDNLILLLSTDANGSITFAEAYWTREYVLRQGGAIGDDTPGQFLTDNSWVGGRFGFTAVPLPASAWLLATGFGIAGAWRRRRRG